MNTEELKDKIMELADKYAATDKDLLDLFWENAQMATLSRVLSKLKDIETISKLEQFFDVASIGRTPDGYPNEFIIKKLNGKEINIEITTRAVAVCNMLEIISDTGEKNEFLKSTARAVDPEKIGYYDRIETNLYYREL